MAIAPSAANKREARRSRAESRLLPAAVSAGSVLAVLLLWWLSGRFGWVSPLFLPPPADVWAAFA
ncbi:hypothetical protein BN871_FG_00160, partial [Paenibacillus sp. P22]